MKEHLGAHKLYALVNNAGIYKAGETEAMIKTNVFGPKLVTEAFAALLDAECGRVVHVSSGSGPMFVQKCSKEEQDFLCSDSNSWEAVENFL